MRQLVELHDNLAAFDALDADIVAIAQREQDPANLARVEDLVGEGLTIVCDPDGKSSMFSLFGTFLIDTEGTLRRAIPGVRQARARIDVVLAELAQLSGRDAPTTHYDEGRVQVQGGGVFDEQQPLSARWAFSHDRFAPGQITKLLFLPEIAPGWKVYAPGSELMAAASIEVSLPQGLSLAEPLSWPRPRVARDEQLGQQLAWYEGDIPLSALVLVMDEDFDGERATVGIALRFQACQGELCLPAETRRFEMTLPVGPADEPRGQLYGWEGW